MKRTLAIPAALVAILGGVIFFGRSRYDVSQVHPSIRSLKRPYQTVEVAYFLDGGSVGLGIIDRDGQRLILAFPYGEDSNGRRIYNRLFIGAAHCELPGAVEVEFTEDTKEYAAELIADCPPGEERDQALLALRGSYCDHVGVLGRELLTRMRRQDPENR